MKTQSYRKFFGIESIGWINTKMSNYLQVLKFCIASVCLMAAYLTFYALSSVNIATRTNSECKASTFYCDKLFGRSNSFNCSSAALNSPEREKRLCSCKEKGKANSNKEESALDSAEQITRESISITHNPSDLTTRHINYFPPDEPSKKGLGALKLPDSLPWKSLELRLIYVLKVLHRSSRVVNVTHIINDLRAAIEIIEDIHTKLDLAYRSSDLISGPESDETHLNGLVNVDKEPSTDTYNLQNDTSYKPPDVCPETFKGTLYGYPFYETGWVKENCTHQKPMEELITIVLDFSKYSNSVASRNLTILDAIEEIYPGVKMIVAVNKELASNANYRSKFHQLSATWLTFPPKVKIGKVLNNLISKVTTPYTYIATGIFSMDEDSRLERLVRELSQLNASVIGSAKKDKEGIWSMNCYQMSYKNYTIIYRAGYHYSRHECVFCNFTEGPFLARTNFLKEHKLDESLQGPLVFRDYFFKLNRLEYSLAVCPDSMLHFVVRSVPGRHEWLQFAQKRHLNKIILANDITHEFSCQELRRGCNFKTGRLVSPCCLKQLAQDILFVMRTCREHHILCELQEGTLLGAVKLGKVLPWERDADITFLSANFTAILQLKAYLQKHGYSISVTDPVTCCRDGLFTGGTIKLQGVRWPIELWGQHQLDSGILTKRNGTKTRIIFHGEKIEVPRNPGWYMRNRYGYEIYKHAQHWMALGLQNSWIEYQAGYFTRCTQPGNHDCLDQYSADGNLQFLYPVP